MMGWIKMKEKIIEALEEFDFCDVLLATGKEITLTKSDDIEFVGDYLLHNDVLYRISKIKGVVV